MRIHLFIFVIYLVAYLFFCLNATFESFFNPDSEDGTPEDEQTYCRYKITDNVFFALI